MKFIISIEIFITHVRLGNMVYSNIQSIKSSYEISQKTSKICNSKQKYISQMSAIDVYI